MAVIKCKMCGGDLMIEPGATVAECEYCGSRQTVPNQDNEKKLTLFARANRLRAACEFDKAAGVYESIVAEFPQEAEAYWGLVLCKYGIEYVDDPATGKKIPTCHRSSFESVLDDGNFDQALENADVVARKVYREEAKQIEELRKGIIEVSVKEEPYDIFICYKETDDKGDRTLDSVLAQDIYDALTEEGYRVFFSRITLEDKLGQEYEPYIFAALNSAKILLAVGTDYEYYNAVWVKNEWSRYLMLMAKDRTKHLIPCYKNIDAYDMPKEFAKLQAQDMGKVGAMQDLLRGIEKILRPVRQGTGKSGEAENQSAETLHAGNNALQNGDWDAALRLFTGLLQKEPGNPQACLGSVLAQEECRTIAELVDARLAASEQADIRMMVLGAKEGHIGECVQKYAIPNYVRPEEIRGLYDFRLQYPSCVFERQKQLAKEEKWWKNQPLLSQAENAPKTMQIVRQEKERLFREMNARLDRARELDEKAKTELKEKYDQAVQAADQQAEKLWEEGMRKKEKTYGLMVRVARRERSTASLLRLAAQFDEMGDYKDSAKLAAYCRKRPADLKRNEWIMIAAAVVFAVLLLRQL